MLELYDYLKTCGVFYLATVEGDQPRVRPLHAAALVGGRLYFRVGKDKGVTAQLLKNPKCELCAFSGKDWMRITCKSLPSGDPAALEALNALHPLREGDGQPQLFYLADGSALLARYAQPVKTIRF